MRLAVLLIGFFGSACSFPAEEAAPCWITGDSSNVITSDEAVLKTELLAIHLDDPSGDAAKRLAHGDYRLLAIGGIAPGYPSLNLSADGEVLCVFGARFIDGITDVYESKEHSRLVSRFREYARLYNSIIIEYYKSEYRN